jgi:hypothetical protein
LVQNVSSYALLDPVQSPSQATGQIKIEEVYIKYRSTQTYNSRAEYRDWDNLDYAPEWYAVNQSEAKPFYIVMDNSIQIFPTPKVSVVNGLILYSNQRPYDLTAAMTDAAILLEREYHDVIAWLLIPYIYQHRQQDERVGYYQQQADVKKSKMLTQLKKRIIRPMK